MNFEEYILPSWLNTHSLLQQFYVNVW
jgi:hypothetical protein